MRVLFSLAIVLALSCNVATAQENHCGKLTANGTLSANTLVLRPCVLIEGTGTIYASTLMVFDVGQLDSLPDILSYNRACVVTPGDINYDREVNFKDFLKFSSGWPNGTNWGTGDFNGDGVQDWDDFDILDAHFGEKSICS